MEGKKEERRWRRFFIDIELLYGVIEGRHKIIYDTDVKIIKDRFNMSTLQHEFIIEHPSYDDVPIGKLIPEATFSMTKL